MSNTISESAPDVQLFFLMTPINIIHWTCAIASFMIDDMKTIAIIKKVDGQLVIELRDEHGTLIDMFPVDEIKEERENGRI